MSIDPEVHRKVEVALAGFSGDVDTARKGLTSADEHVRGSALWSLNRLNALTEDEIRAALGDLHMNVRLAAAELSASYNGIDLLGALDDPEFLVVEMAAWSCGEREDNSDEVMAKLIDVGQNHQHQLAREAAIAALGAIGDPRGLPTILKGCRDKPAIRRRAVLALAPFDGPEVDAAIERALLDKDWQVRQSAEDLRR